MSEFDGLVGLMVQLRFPGWTSEVRTAYWKAADLYEKHRIGGSPEELFQATHPSPIDMSDTLTPEGEPLDLSDWLRAAIAFQDEIESAAQAGKVGPLIAILGTLAGDRSARELGPALKCVEQLEAENAQLRTELELERTQNEVPVHNRAVSLYAMALGLASEVCKGKPHRNHASHIETLLRRSDYAEYAITDDTIRAIIEEGSSILKNSN